MKLVPKSSPALWTRADPVVDIATEAAPHVTGMLQLCLVSGGVALAAPQVGISKQFFVVSGNPGRRQRIVINPNITLYGPDVKAQREGCLSDPGEYAEVVRSRNIVVNYTDEHGQLQQDVVLSALEARIFQHEYDHLQGRCIFSRPTPHLS